MMRVLGLLIVALLTGCASSPPLQYYSLQGASPPVVVANPGAKLTVYIGPVTVPEALDRPQLVYRDGDHISVLDGQRWIEPLKIAAGRVLATTLTADLGGAIVGAYPGTALTSATYRVQVEIQQLEAAPTGATSFAAVWSVRTESGDPLTGRTFGTTQGGADYHAMAVAYTQAVMSIGHDIAAALRANLGNQK